MSSALSRLSRNERRLLLSNEEKLRETGRWGPWETITFPRGSAGRSWAAEFTEVRKNSVFSVLVRDIVGTDGGTYTHLAISSLSGTRPTWWEAQRIKNELAGDDAVAVEVYPPQAEVVDDADMFHLWVLPRPFPCSIWEGK